MISAGITGHQDQLHKIEIMFQKKKLPGVLLLQGISGLGKKKIALRLAQSIFCQQDKKPCLSCPHCLAIAEDNFSDFIYLFPGENGKIPIGNFSKNEPGTVRWFINRLSRKSFSGQYAVIIDQVEAISLEGQNALLKTIEEPGGEHHFFLVSSNRAQIIPTLLSRCLELKFFPLKNQELKNILSDQLRQDQDNLDVDLDLLLIMANGSVELSLLLAKNKNYQKVLALTEKISLFFKNESFLDLEIDPLKKEIGFFNLIRTLINIYQWIIKSSLKNKPRLEEIEKISSIDLDKIKKIIKILLALSEKSYHNLNLKYYLKGSLTSIKIGKE